MFDKLSRSWEFARTSYGIIWDFKQSVVFPTISALLGTAWTIMTYFVMPVIVIGGVGPIEAFKRSAGTLKRTWGEALVGSFSLGLLSLLPIIVVAVVLVMLAVSA